jgi:hypothetical protein
MLVVHKLLYISFYVKSTPPKAYLNPPVGDIQKREKILIATLDKGIAQVVHPKNR